MRHLVLIALGGSLGALARYAVTGWVRHATSLPGFYGTIMVNIGGSLLMGIVYVIITERVFLHPDWRSILMVGLLGAFTTFSSFSLEAVLLIEQGRLASAGLYALASIALCVASCAAGMTLARSLASI